MLSRIENGIRLEPPTRNAHKRWQKALVIHSGVSLSVAWRKGSTALEELGTPLMASALGAAAAALKDWLIGHASPIQGAFRTITWKHGGIASASIHWSHCLPTAPVWPRKRWNKEQVEHRCSRIGFPLIMSERRTLVSDLPNDFKK